MQKLLKGFWFLLTFVLLTLLTQVGGIVLLFSYGISRLPVFPNFRKFRTLVVFILLYFVTSIFIIPPMASLNGRVPLNIFNQTLRPLNFMTCLLNRHYVRDELKQSVLEISQQMNQKYPGTILYYLDASFPFIDKYPLLPHLSHNDGKKLDICFFYKSIQGEKLRGHPSIIGYGVYEGPKPSETNMPQYCRSAGYWQYGIMKKIIPQFRKKNFLFDEARTKSLILNLVQHKNIKSIYIEPHLKERLKLSDPKIKFHGCFAVRHDDHIHINLN